MLYSPHSIPLCLTVYALAGMDAICTCANGGIDIQAYHYGQLSAAVREYNMAMQCVEEILAQPAQRMEAGNKLLYGVGWTVFTVDFNLVESSRAMLEKFDFTIATADETVDLLVPHSLFQVRPRGDTTPGYPMSAELYGWMIKIACALLSDNKGEVNQLCDTLPSWEDHLTIAAAR
eukprot:COSAG01_NODE_909_length_12785_cov_4.201876_9_plen_176_part_00